MNTDLRPGAPVEPIETASRDELTALQVRRLRQSLDRAWRGVEHYRRKFREAGIAPEDLRDLADLARFPFTTKEDLRRNYPYGMFAVPMRDVVRVHASSGTTGRPTVVGYTRRDIDTWADIMARGLRAAGAGAGDIVHNTHGYGLFTGGLGVHYGAERLGATVVPVSGGMTERQVQLIRDFGATVLVGTPSYVLTLADEMARQGFDARASRLRLCICGAEPWTSAMRAEIEQRLGVDALDLFGLSEVIGPGVAIECLETKDGLTVWEDHFYPEIIDPNTGAVLPDGELGELVFTSLTKEAMPVVRYRTRDLTRLLPGTARTMRRIAKIVGRSDDMLIIRGVNVFPTQVEELLLRHGKLAPHYQLRVSREGRLDRLDVHVEMRTEYGGRMLRPEREAIEAEVSHQIKSYIGVSAAVHVREPDSIERTLVGKAKRIVDERPRA
ncbi:MAG: phenylacetate--CoA ligase [Rhodocyclaceae bacterium]